MGTRALLHIQDEEKNTLATIYTQYDGYPNGFGALIYFALNKGNSKIVNGFSLDDKIPTSFNGMGCLAAYLIGTIKDNKIGHIYLMPPNTSDVWETFTYYIFLEDNELHMKIDSKGQSIFNDALNKFDPNL